jgi:hypothetical protein
MKKCRRVFLAAIAIAGAAMAAEDGSGTATVVIYRNSGAGTLKSPPVYMDRVKVAELGNKRYFSVSVSPGIHSFWSSPNHVVELKIENNGKYFILAQYPDQGGIKGFNWFPKLHLLQVTAEQGERDTRTLNPLDSKHIFNTSTVAR